MFLSLERKKTTLSFRTGILFLVLAFFADMVMPSAARAQALAGLPVPGTMITPSPGFAPAVLRGIKVHSDDPFRFDFIIDAGESGLEDEALKEESRKLIRYFLASVTVPDEDIWVNLSPYEEDRIIPKEFGITQMGRDLLAQDYVLKQLTASLIYPEDAIGKAFWDRVYKKAHELYGTTEVPVNTFNKVWIVPDKARVYTADNTAFVAESRLKVMLEEDYLALDNNLDNADTGTDRLEEKDVKALSSVSSQVVRELVIPAIEKEVNEGQNFAPLRQVYHSLILAVWFKKNLRESLLGRVYMDRNKVLGVDIEDRAAKEKIYARYLAAFKKGVYDYIREDYDPYMKRALPRRYFSGGFNILNFRENMKEEPLTLASAREYARRNPDSALHVIGGFLVARHLGHHDEGRFAHGIEGIVEELRGREWEVPETKAADGGPMHDLKRVIEEHGKPDAQGRLTVTFANGGKMRLQEVDGYEFLVVIDPARFGADYTGLGNFQLAVYVRDEATLPHEFEEFRRLKDYALENNAAIEVDIRDGRLHAALYDYLNDTQNRLGNEQLLERQNGFIAFMDDAHRAGLRAEGKADEADHYPHTDKLTEADRGGFDFTIASWGNKSFERQAAEVSRLVINGKFGKALKRIKKMIKSDKGNVGNLLKSVVFACMDKQPSNDIDFEDSLPENSIIQFMRFLLKEQELGLAYNFYLIAKDTMIKNIYVFPRLADIETWSQMEWDLMDALIKEEKPEGAHELFSLLWNEFVEKSKMPGAVIDDIKKERHNKMISEGKGELKSGARKAQAALEEGTFLNGVDTASVDFALKVAPDAFLARMEKEHGGADEKAEDIRQKVEKIKEENPKGGYFDPGDMSGMYRLLGPHGPRLERDHAMSDSIARWGGDMPAMIQSGLNVRDTMRLLRLYETDFVTTAHDDELQKTSRYQPKALITIDPYGILPPNSGYFFKSEYADDFQWYIVLNPSDDIILQNLAEFKMAAEIDLIEHAYRFTASQRRILASALQKMAFWDGETLLPDDLDALVWKGTDEDLIRLLDLISEKKSPHFTLYAMAEKWGISFRDVRIDAEKMLAYEKLFLTKAFEAVLAATETIKREETNNVARAMLSEKLKQIKAGIQDKEIIKKIESAVEKAQNTLQEELDQLRQRSDQIKNIISKRPADPQTMNDFINYLNRYFPGKNVKEFQDVLGRLDPRMKERIMLRFFYDDVVELKKTNGESVSEVVEKYVRKVNEVFQDYLNSQDLEALKNIEEQFSIRMGAGRIPNNVEEKRAIKDIEEQYDLVLEDPGFYAKIFMKEAYLDFLERTPASSTSEEMGALRVRIRNDMREDPGMEYYDPENVRGMAREAAKTRFDGSDSIQDTAGGGGPFGQGMKHYESAQVPGNPGGPAPMSSLAGGGVPGQGGSRSTAEASALWQMEELKKKEQRFVELAEKKNRPSRYLLEAKVIFLNDQIIGQETAAYYFQRDGQWYIVINSSLNPLLRDQAHYRAAAAVHLAARGYGLSDEQRHTLAAALQRQAYGDGKNPVPFDVETLEWNGTDDGAARLVKLATDAEGLALTGESLGRAVGRGISFMDEDLDPDAALANEKLFREEALEEALVAAEYQYRLSLAELDEREVEMKLRYVESQLGQERIKDVRAQIEREKDLLIQEIEKLESKEKLEIIPLSSKITDKEMKDAVQRLGIINKSGAVFGAQPWEKQLIADYLSHGRQRTLRAKTDQKIADARGVYHDQSIQLLNEHVPEDNVAISEAFGNIFQSKEDQRLKIIRQHEETIAGSRRQSAEAIEAMEKAFADAKSAGDEMDERSVSTDTVLDSQDFRGLFTLYGETAGESRLPKDNAMSECRDPGGVDRGLASAVAVNREDLHLEAVLPVGNDEFLNRQTADWDEDNVSAKILKIIDEDPFLQGLLVQENLVPDARGMQKVPKARADLLIGQNGEFFKISRWKNHGFAGLYRRIHEAQIIARLNKAGLTSPEIPRLAGIDFKDGELQLHMTGMAGGVDLMSSEGQQLSVVNRLDIFFKATRIFYEMHSLGLANNDLNSGGILFNLSTGQVMIIDFDEAYFVNDPEDAGEAYISLLKIVLNSINYRKEVLPAYWQKSGLESLAFDLSQKLDQRPAPEYLQTVAQKLEKIQDYFAQNDSARPGLPGDHAMSDDLTPEPVGAVVSPKHGGIDFDPRKVGLEEEGEDLELNLAPGPADIRRIEAGGLDGLDIRIFNMAPLPVMNLPMILGVGEDNRRESGEYAYGLAS